MVVRLGNSVDFRDHSQDVPGWGELGYGSRNGFCGDRIWVGDEDQRRDRREGNREGEIELGSPY